MGAGKKAKNMAKATKGKVKETTGKAVGNEGLEAKGKGEQTLAGAKHAVQKTKGKLKG